MSSAAALTPPLTLDLPAIGAPFEGGFLAGRLALGDQIFALIVAPKPEGEHEGLRWMEGADDLVAASASDGLANAQALLAAPSVRFPAVEWCRSLRIASHDDWYLPSKAELEICYRNLKPTADTNWRGHGRNEASVPAGQPYEPSSPGQTGAEAFRSGAEQAFEPLWYWSSTEFSADDAWRQNFDDGDQSADYKLFVLRVRAVRKVLIS